MFHESPSRKTPGFVVVPCDTAEGKSWACVAVLVQSGSYRLLEDRRELGYDVVQDVGLEIGRMGRIYINEKLRVTFPNVIEQHGAETFHQRDGTVVRDGQRRVF